MRSPSCGCWPVDTACGCPVATSLSSSRGAGRAGTLHGQGGLTPSVDSVSSHTMWSGWTHVLCEPCVISPSPDHQLGTICESFEFLPNPMPPKNLPKILHNLLGFPHTSHLWGGGLKEHIPRVLCTQRTLIISTQPCSRSGTHSLPFSLRALIKYTEMNHDIPSLLRVGKLLTAWLESPCL